MTLIAALRIGAHADATHTGAECASGGVFVSGVVALRRSVLAVGVIALRLGVGFIDMRCSVVALGVIALRQQSFLASVVVTMRSSVVDLWRGAGSCWSPSVCWC